MDSPVSINVFCGYKSAGKAAGDACVLQFGFEGSGVGDAEVKDAGGEGGVGFAARKDLGEVSGGACATAGDDGDLDGLGDECGELAVEAVAHAIGVHAGEEDLACAALLGFAGP